MNIGELRDAAKYAASMNVDLIIVPMGVMCIGKRGGLRCSRVQSWDLVEAAKVNILTDLVDEVWHQLKMLNDAGAGAGTERASGT